ncbi:hypothetical protein [Pseudonocardia spinosispora]|uniref:hypothetical protein n=1 Tax=Pseudonocardia spinosispora TaxID=103441 RepID=UPI00048F27B2|nr:hypothetical protein [Pseudonocardia spinosispora]
MSTPYIGSGPYCYANSLAMSLGADAAPSASVIEVLTGSPFGMSMADPSQPFFDPDGWTPEIGLDAAIELLGWTCTTVTGEPAADRLRRAGPLLVGPVSMEHLAHLPDAGDLVGADHFLVVLGVDGDVVRFHDPQGFPFATLPVGNFLDAWRAESVGYPHEPFTMRTEFHKVRDVPIRDALTNSLPNAKNWLTRGNSAAAAHQLAEAIEMGLNEELRAHLVQFAIKVGAHRLVDAATCLGGAGHPGVAEVLGRQAVIVGALQYPVLVDDRPRAAALLRKLADGYSELMKALSDS